MHAGENYHLCGKNTNVKSQIELAENLEAEGIPMKQRAVFRAFRGAFQEVQIKADS
jgi:hypothetical protein